jgi:hypothetical protein
MVVDIETRAFVFPSGTILSAGGFLVIWCDDVTNTTPGLTLGRAFSSVAPSVSLVQPGLLYLDRIYQTDIRFTKTIRYRATTIRPTVSVFNLFNAINPSGFRTRVIVPTTGAADATLLQPTSYSGDFRRPEQRVGQIGLRFTF